MNFLSHHWAARQVGTEQAPLFFAGNLAPDWIGLAGEGSIRRHHVEGKTGALADGARLHIDADMVFHSDPVFHALCERASGLLRTAPFTQPLHRRFFFAHVAVELAMDCHLLRSEDDHADDLFQRLERCVGEIAPATAQLLEVEALPRLDRVVQRFVEHRWVLAYATEAGLARRLSELGRRLRLADLSERDEGVLAEVFETLVPEVAAETPGLLHRAGAVWYNAGANATRNHDAHADDDRNA